MKLDDSTRSRHEKALLSSWQSWGVFAMTGNVTITWIICLMKPNVAWGLVKTNDLSMLSVVFQWQVCQVCSDATISLPYRSTKSVPNLSLMNRHKLCCVHISEPTHSHVSCHDDYWSDYCIIYCLMNIIHAYLRVYSSVRRSHIGNDYWAGRDASFLFKTDVLPTLMGSWHASTRISWFSHLGATGAHTLLMDFSDWPSSPHERESAASVLSFLVLRPNVQ